MSQLGSGNGSGRPLEIDTRQIYRNASAAAPDSDTRVDAEFMNDVLDAIIKNQTELGTNPQGTFGSVAARLNQYLPGGGVSPSSIPFTNASTVTIPGTVHRLATGNILFQVYDGSIPAQAVSPSDFAVTINPASYDVTLDFIQPQTGFVVLSAATPVYTLSFTAATTLNIAGTAHNLGTPDLFYVLYNATAPLEVLEPASFTVDPTNNNAVAITFSAPQDGTVLLSAAGPRAVTTVAVPSTQWNVTGGTHGLGTQALLFQVYDDSTPRVPVEPQTLTVDPVSYDVVATFASAQSGRLILAAVPGNTGTDFEIRDAGIANTSAVIVKSASGSLNLQQGIGNHTYFRNRLGTIVADLDTTGKLGLGGLTNPTFQIQLASDSAAKPGTNTWTVASDERLKEVLRPFTDGLALLLQLEPLVYRYNGKGGLRATKEEQIGLLAQALQPLAPYMVTSYRGRLTPQDSETDILTYNGHAMAFVLLNAIKELHARLTTVEAAYQESQETIQALQATAEQFEQRLQALEGSLS